VGTWGRPSDGLLKNRIGLPEWRFERTDVDGWERSRGISISDQVVSYPPPARQQMKHEDASTGLLVLLMAVQRAADSRAETRPKVKTGRGRSNEMHNRNNRNNEADLYSWLPGGSCLQLSSSHPSQHGAQEKHETKQIMWGLVMVAAQLVCVCLADCSCRRKAARGETRTVVSCGHGNNKTTRLRNKPGR
jgi:hypothetical protein